MNSPPSQDNACIYCASCGPFSAEHVIPAGMGGDDKRFVLHDVVCKNCNTAIFSPLEAAFLRNSPTAIGRMFMQGEGRQRGKKTSSPTLDAKSKILISDEGCPFEIEFGPNGKPFLLPQLVLVGENLFKSTATTRSDQLNFIDALRTQLTDVVTCIRKNRDNVPPTFELTSYAWNGKSYVQPVEKQLISNAPPSGIWHELMEDSEGKERVSRSRIFLSPRKQIVLRVADDLGAAEAITLYRRCLEQTDFAKVDAEEGLIEKPLVAVGMSVRVDATDRVLAKIGLNMLAHVAGATYVRHAGFDETKKAILSGTPELFSSSSIEHEEMQRVLARVPKDHHLFMIFGAHHPIEGYALGLTVKLYGSQIITVKLGRNLPKMPISIPIVFLVNYTTHTVNHVDLIEFARIIRSNPP